MICFNRRKNPIETGIKEEIVEGTSEMIAERLFVTRVNWDKERLRHSSTCLNWQKSQHITSE